MAQDLSAQFLDTVGMEIEGEGLRRDSLYEALRNKFEMPSDNLPFIVTRDASTESIGTYLRTSNSDSTINFYTHTEDYRKFLSSARGNTATFGYELVFSPQTIEKLKPVLFKTLETLKAVGDFKTPRSAIHIHVGFAHNIKIMKKLLKVCLNIDPFLFRLGGMGGTFRGVSNLSAYARPLLNSCAVPTGIALSTQNHNRSIRATLDAHTELYRIENLDSSAPSIPQYQAVEHTSMDNESDDDDYDDSDDSNILPDDPPVEIVKKYFQIINPIAALEAKTTEEFWECFGVFPKLTGLTKYHPCRYVGSNFYSIAQHGTMEFRHFNQSFDYDLLIAIAKFLRAVVEMSTRLTKSQVSDFTPKNPNIEISVADAEEVLSMIVSYFAITEVEDAPSSHELRLIMETLEKSHFVELPKTPVMCHNREFSIPENLTYRLLSVENPLKPTNIDIHNVESKNLTILGGF